MEEEKIIFDVDTTKATTSLKDLRTELKSAKDAMLNAQEGTDEYNAALKRAAQAQLTMKEMNEQIKGSAMDVGEVLANTTKVVGGLAGGINAINGVTALMGVENENLQKTFVKLQAGMAVVQGLQGIDGMMKGFQNLSIVMSQSAMGIKVLTAVQKAWNYVVSMNPIFLLVTALAAVTAGVLLFTKAMRDNNSEIAESNRLLDANRNYQNLLAEDMEYNAKLAAALGKSQIEILRGKLKAQQELDAVNEQEIERLYNKIYVEQEATDEEKKRYDELLNKRKEYGDKIKQLNDDIIIADIANRKKVQDDYVANNKKIEEEQRKHNEKLLLDAQKWNDEFATARFDNSMRELDDLMKQNEEWSDSNYEWNLGKQDRQLESDKRFAELQYQALVDKHNAFDDLDRIALANGAITEYEYQMSTLENQIAFNEEILNNTRLTEEEKTRIEAENAEARRAIRELELQGAMYAVSATGKLLGQASDLLGKKTAEGKAMAVISATISAFESASGAYNSLIKTPYVGPVIAPIAAGVAFATGMKNVKAIKAVKVPKGGGGEGGSGESGISAPSINTSAPSITNAIQATRNVTTPAEIELQKQPIKAYVVESEITSTQNRISSIKNEASF